MDDDADAAREYERLRAELAEFVLGVLTERLAAGQEPQLSQALIDAIDRRVDDAVAARLGNAGLAEAERPARTTRRPPPKESWFTKGRVIALAAVAAVLVAAAVYFFLNRTTGVTKTQTYNGIEVINVEPTPDGVNAQRPPANGFVPANDAAPPQPAAPPPQP